MAVLVAVIVVLAALCVLLTLLHARERAQLLRELRHAHNLAVARTPGEVAAIERAQQPRPTPSPARETDEPTTPYFGD